MHFGKVLIRKPAASRKESREVYLVAKGFKG
jgi:23S rRNA U2552 (ribose-2'-O)-methylase RlmE/FtsJ